MRYRDRAVLYFAMLGAIVAVYIRAEHPNLDAIFQFGLNFVDSAAKEQSIVRVAFYPESVAVVNLAINVKRDFRSAEVLNNEVVQGVFPLPHESRVASGSECIFSLKQILWRGWQGFGERMASDPCVYPTTHIIGGRLPAVLEQQVRDREGWFGQIQCGTFQADVSPQLSLRSVTARQDLLFHQANLGLHVFPLAFDGFEGALSDKSSPDGYEDDSPVGQASGPKSLIGPVRLVLGGLLLALDLWCLGRRDRRSRIAGGWLMCLGLLCLLAPWTY